MLKTVFLFILSFSFYFFTMNEFIHTFWCIREAFSHFTTFQRIVLSSAMNFVHDSANEKRFKIKMRNVRDCDSAQALAYLHTYIEINFFLPIFKHKKTHTHIYLFSHDFFLLIFLLLIRLSDQQINMYVIIGAHFSSLLFSLRLPLPFPQDCP